MKMMRKFLFGLSALLLSGTMVFSAALPALQPSDTLSSANGNTQTGSVSDITGTVRSDLTQFFDDSVVEKLPESVTADQQISVILTIDGETVLDAYDELETKPTMAEFAVSKEGWAISRRIEKESNALLTRLTNAGVSYEVGNRYDTLLGGVEVTIKASAFDTLCKAVNGKAGVWVGEEYAECETQAVTNDVNVYETGIFNSSDSRYDGTGTVIAVLDTGLDYTHSAFDPKRFNTDASTDRITMNSLRSVVGKLEAAKTSPGLTAANVYLNRKVPYAYDYADKDDDVAPINNEHGTHVAGIMVGNDIDVNPSGIRGVAPNAQLAVMKVFSESSSGAKTSWLLAALEDCVTLEVDVINMSLGTAAGFSRETDEDVRYEIYDRIKARGISLVAAASNDYNATFGSEKNGNLGLTSNPDSSTVGSPSTYDAALSVASISGVKTPYLLYNGTIVYFTEASDSAAKPKDFVEDILADGEYSHEFEYEIIPGVGSAQNFAEYADEFGNPNGKLNGKIALIRRGQTNFEEKANLARQYGAVGCIIYNNVSGTISMNVGHLGDYPVCSLSQDDGEMLVKGGNGKITISRDQEAGPFMSDFSSWGPTPDLRIKPEITAHGGDIYSAIPGGGYDRMSGTSMASPNQAGVTALIRQYVKEKFPTYDAVQVAALVNQLMMSTADIALNTNGLPFSVRKQGAGLANLKRATETPAYLQTYDRDTGAAMDKTKIELGDDPEKKGVYTMTFSVVNMENTTLSYEVGAQVLTEGVSETLTYKGDTTVTEKGYLLEGAEIEVTAIENGTKEGNKITVLGGQSATVTLTVTLSGENKTYLDKSFKNGMYVEGFVTLEAKDGTQYSLNAPFLAYYGSWHQAPLFDLDYFATNADELDESKETLEKTLPDAYATRPIGGLYNDYIAYLGSFAYLQDPASTSKIAASREHIALSNQLGSEEGSQGGVNSIASVSLGLLRGAKSMTATVKEATTGTVIFEKTEYDLSKSYNYGGAIYGGNYEVDFNVTDYDLPNNNEYIFTLKGYIDYEDGSVTNDTFEFPFYTDYTAPIVTGVEYTFEYDRSTETNRLFANISIYDNHYVQAIFPGYISRGSQGYEMNTFFRYPVPVIGGRNTTSVVQVELTDQLAKIKNGSYNKNSFIVQTVDYALNTSMFEITIPDDIAKIEFSEEEIKISPNELYNLKPVITPSQDKAWAESIVYRTLDESIARVVDGKLVGVSSGSTELIATSNRNSNVTARVPVTVLSEGQDGYHKYDRPIAEDFRLTGYHVNKVYYFVSSSDRDLGADEAGANVKFSNSSTYSLKMLPSESVTIQYDLTGYFDDKDYRVEFTSSNPNVAEVDKNGTIVAKNVDADGKPLNSERSTTVYARLLMRDPATGEFKPTITSRTIYITVKEAYTTNGPYLVSYKGLGDKVEIPLDLGITEIQQFAFSNYDLVPKDLAAGDEISEEDPYYSKQWYIGDSTITEVIIPEGVKTIGMYAFAGLTALRSITLPSTLTKIQTGAFLNCTSLAEVKYSGENNLQFINQRAFEGCTMLTGFNFRSIIAIGDAAFQNAGLISIQLPADTQSIGANAFANNVALAKVQIAASKVKIGAGAFYNCSSLSGMSLNASVVPASIFRGCSSLSTLTLGADVEVIGEYALRGTSIKTLSVNGNNPYFESGNSGKYLVEKGTHVLALVAPATTQFDEESITEVGAGAFSVATGLLTVDLPNVKTVGDYAFANCSRLRSLKLGELESVGKYAFTGTAITTLPALAQGVSIGERAFAGTALTTVTVPQNATVGEYAFAQDTSLSTVKVEAGAELQEGAFFANYTMRNVEIGEGVTIGEAAFAATTGAQLGSYAASGNYFLYAEEMAPTNINPFISALSTLKIGQNADIGAYAFRGAGSGVYEIGGRNLGGVLTEVDLGANAIIGDYAFNSCVNLSKIDLSQAKSIGAYAFAGSMPEFIAFQSGERLQVRVSSWAPALTKIDLSGLDPEIEMPLGTGAFANETKLKEVILPETLQILGVATFEGCTSLDTVTLSNLALIGANAFAGTALSNITLTGDGAFIGNGAFDGCTQLTTAQGLDKVQYIGSRAFARTAIKEADLSAATVLDDFAFADSAVTSVKLGAELTTLGENPFAGCAIPEFSDENGNTTFDLNEAVKVIDGVLYDTCVNGLVLKTYPIAKESKTFKIAEGVARVGAEAFRDADLLSVELTRRVKAVGDKAFYGCDKLAVVVFTSIEAPILEETYSADIDNGWDEDGYPLYLSENYANYTISNGTVFGLGVVPYKMWFADGTTALHGGNFIASIGTAAGRKIHEDKTLVMVRPLNGTGYENFLYGQYFDVVVNGAIALTDETQLVIDLIDTLPSPVTLDDQPLVEQIRGLFEELSYEQKGCVSNINTLIEAEDWIQYLLSQQPSGEPTTNEEGIPLLWLYITLGAVAVGALVAVALVLLLKKEKKDPAPADEDKNDASEPAKQETPAENDHEDAEDFEDLSDEE